MRISVIIPSYNSYRTLKYTLFALERQTRRDLIAEILVVDSSDDGRSKRMRPYCEAHGVRWIEAGVRTMPAAARNIGARRAAGEVLAFIDSDAYMSDDWIEKAAVHAALGHKTGGGAVRMPDWQRNKWIPWAQYFLQFNEYMDVGRPRVKPFLPSCNMFCERRLFFRCGGFPKIRASEDVLFFLRANRLADVWFIPDMSAGHIFREQLRPFLKNQMLLGRYILAYRRIRSPRKFYLRGGWPALFLPAFAAIKLWRISARSLASRPALAARYLAALPLVAAGLLSWSLGFLKEAFAPSPVPPGLAGGNRAPAPGPESVRVMNVGYHNLSVRDAVARCLGLLRADAKGSVFFLNLDGLQKAQKDAQYLRVLESASLVLPDGIGLRLVTSLCGGHMRENCNGTDLSPLLMAELARAGRSLFLYGGRPGVAEKAAEALARRIPGIRIAGTEHGYGPGEAALEKINRSRADVLFVGLGVPLQEKWIFDNRARLQPGLCLGVGALFDWLSGRRRRCPPALRSLNLEWFWRILIEPRRMFRRYMVDGLAFLAALCARRLRLPPAGAGDKPAVFPNAPASSAGMRNCSRR